MVEHIVDRLSQTGIRFDLLLGKLPFQPLVQIFHQRAAVVLMKTQALLRRHALRGGNCVKMVDLPQCFDEVLTFIGKVVGHLDKIAAAVCETICQQDLELFGGIARQGITHLDRWIKTVLPLVQNGRQVFAGVFAAGAEYGDLATVEDREDAKFCPVFNSS